MIDVGLIGCGGISKGHLEAYRRIPDVKVVAVCDLDLQRAKKIAHDYQISRIYTNHLDFLERNSLDLIDICTPTTTHYRIVIDSCKYTNHILLEKPIARTTKHSLEMFEEARKNGVSLCICHTQLFFPSVVESYSKVRTRQLDVDRCTVTIRGRESGGEKEWVLTSEQGGLLWEIGYHAAYLLQFFIGDLNKLYAVSDRKFFPVDDRFVVIARSDKAKIGIIDIDATSDSFEWTFDLDIRKNGRIHGDLYFDYSETRRTALDGSLRVFAPAILEDFKSLFYQLRFAARYVFRGRDFLSRAHIGLIREYCKRIFVGDGSTPVAVEDAIKAVNVLECIEESINSDKPVLCKQVI